MSGLVTVHDQTNTPGTRHAHTLAFFFSLVFFPAVRLFMLPLAWLYRAAPWWLPLPFAAALSGSLRLWWLTHGQTDRQVWQTYWLEQGALLKQLLILFGAIVHRHLSGLDGTPLPQEVLPLGVFLHYGQAVWPAALSTAALLASLLDLWRRFRSRTDPASSSLKGEDAVGTGKGKGTVPRADEGVHDASRGQEPGPRSWLVDGVIPDRYVSILYADGGVGKSMLAAYLGLCVTLGKDFLGWRVQQGKVLYIDGELDKHEWTRRLYMLSRGMGLVKPPRIYYYKLPGVFKEQWVRDRVRKRLTHCRPWWQFWPASKPVMVVFDSMTIAAGAGVAATDEVVTDLFKEWESWGIPVIAIDHITKPSSGDPRLARPFACYSEDTEVLTHSGWKRHDQCIGEEIVVFDPSTETARWSVPQALHSYQYIGEMIHFSTRSTDVLVTPNHRMLVRPAWKSPSTGLVPKKHAGWSFAEAEQMTNELYHTPYAVKFECDAHDVSVLEIGSSTYRADDFLRFLGWWIAEGSIGDGGIQLAQKAGHLATLMQECLRTLGIDFCENTKLWPSDIKRGRTTRMCYIRTRNTKELSSWLITHAGRGAAHKKIPSLVFSLSVRQQRVFLDALIDGDGHRYSDEYIGYYTISKQLADDVQMLAVQIGLSASMKGWLPVSASYGMRYRILIGRESRNTVTLRGCGSQKMSAQREHYDGIVYCFTVETGAYLTRRNGHIAIHGNSQFKWNNARSIMLLLTPGKDAPPGVTLELFHRKTNFGTLFGSRYMTIMRDDQQMAYLPLLGANEQAQGQEQAWTASEPGSSRSRASVQEVTEPLLMLPPPASLDAFERVYEQVLLAGEGGVTAQEIAAVLGVKTKTVQNRLTALSKEGRVKTIRIGVYVVGNGR